MSEITYRDAGVDIEAGDRFVDSIKQLCQSTHNEAVLSPLGGFGGLFAFPAGRYRDPVLVSGTDGVGTKLKLAFAMGRHHTIGIDLVAMCANDILVCGAEPLFFLDYMATGRLSGDVAVEVVRGIVDGCKQAGCALIGGETAEMPGFYQVGEYDLAGFVVGAVERDRIIDGQSIVAGDRLVGLRSSGLHSNGFSLARLVLETRGIELDQPFDAERTVGDALLEPTRIYAEPIKRLLHEGVTLKGVAHITGGGLPGNVPRILPPGCQALLDPESWQVPELFRWLMRESVSRQEMARTFNLGLGMVLVLPAAEVDRALSLLGEGVVVGEVVAGQKSAVVEGWSEDDG